jgi:hypothetical protein
MSYRNWKQGGIMSEKRLRGTRLGSISNEREDGATFAETIRVTFRTVDGEDFAVTFAADIELPYQWENPQTGKIGRRLLPDGSLITGEDPNAPTPPAATVTPWEQLMKRRTIPELEELLEERLAELRKYGSLAEDGFKRSA